MKVKTFFLFLMFPILANCQIKQLHFKGGNRSLPLPIERIAVLEKHDYAKLWIQTDNAQVFGFIGDNYQRIRIKIISVTKDSADGSLYHVAGKSMVKNNVCNFKGVIKISGIRRYKETSYGVDDSYRNKVKGQYSLTGNYTFYEVKTQNHTGIFKGIFQTDFYVNKQNDIIYDDIDMQADGFSNNQFVGSWTSYNSTATKTCNWGDYRMPNSGKFDVGAGEFSPDAKDKSLGWQTIVDRFSQDKIKQSAAKKEEERAWWK
jgi:hypothetical protein